MVSCKDVSPEGQGGGAALLAGFLGWTLDAFDYFLVVMCLTDIGRDLHKSDEQMAVAIALTLAMRPVGALIFGLVADRYGRRLPLMLDLVVFSVVEVLCGCVHSFAAFLILRIIFGIAMGGEWGVGASLVMEKVSPKWRGVLSGLLQEGYAAGYLLAAVAYYLVSPRWGWRPLFFIGGLPALLALFVRFGVKESEAWQRERASGWSELGTGILRHWKIFLYLVVLMMMLNLSSHGTQDLYPTFLKRQWNFSPRERSALTAFSMVGAILGGLTFGLMSDRIGRRRAMVLAFIGAVIVVPLWALPGTVPMLVAGAFALQFMIQGAWGVIPAHLIELCPAGMRGVLPGFAYQVGNLAASYIAIAETIGAKRFGYSHVMAISAAIICVVAAIVTALGKERRGMPFGNPAAIERC